MAKFNNDNHKLHIIPLILQRQKHVKSRQIPHKFVANSQKQLQNQSKATRSQLTPPIVTASVLPTISVCTLVCHMSNMYSTHRAYQ